MVFAGRSVTGFAWTRCACSTWQIIAMYIFGWDTFPFTLAQRTNESDICILSQCRSHETFIQLSLLTLLLSVNKSFTQRKFTSIWILKHSKPFKYSTHIKYTLRNHYFKVGLLFASHNDRHSHSNWNQHKTGHRTACSQSNNTSRHWNALNMFAKATQNDGSQRMFFVFAFGALIKLHKSWAPRAIFVVGFPFFRRANVDSTFSPDYEDEYSSIRKFTAIPFQYNTQTFRAKQCVAHPVSGPNRMDCNRAKQVVRWLKC